MQYKFKLKVLICFTTTILKMNALIFMEQEKYFFKVANYMSERRSWQAEKSWEIMSIISISKQYMGENSYLMCKLSDLVINICLLHFFYLTLSKFLSLRHVSMPYFQFWRPCLLLPCKKRGDWFTGKPDVGLNYQIFLILRDEYCL